MEYKLNITAGLGKGYNQAYKFLDKRTEQLGSFQILEVRDKVNPYGCSLPGSKGKGYIERTITYTTIKEALERYTIKLRYDSVYKAKKGKIDFLKNTISPETKNVNLEGICESLHDKWKKETNLVKDLVDLINYGKPKDKDNKYFPRKKGLLY